MKKKVLSIVLAVIIIVGMLPLSAFVAITPETGNPELSIGEDGAYHITSAEDWTKFGNMVTDGSNTFKDKTVVLDADNLTVNKKIGNWAEDGSEKIFAGTFDGNEYTENFPVNVGKYYVKVSVADKAITADFEIKKATLTANDFIFTPPENCVCDGQPKNATIFTEKEGMGNITVKYQKYNGTDWDVTLTDAPTNSGKYRVFVCVDEGENYYSSDLITSDGWVFELTAPTCMHEYVDGKCIHCDNDQPLEGAQNDAVRVIQNTVDHSEDTVLKLLEENAVDAIQSAGTVVEVIKARNYWLTAINKQLGSEAHTHTFADGYSYDENHHWKECTCEGEECKGFVSGFGEHNFDEGVKSGIVTVYTCRDCGCKKTVLSCDVNGDGKIDANDLALLKIALLGGCDYYGVLDFNGDDKIDILDMVRLKKHLSDETVPLGKQESKPQAQQPAPELAIINDKKF